MKSPFVDAICRIIFKFKTNKIESVEVVKEEWMNETYDPDVDCWWWNEEADIPPIQEELLEENNDE